MAKLLISQVAIGTAIFSLLAPLISAKLVDTLMMFRDFCMRQYF